MSIEITLDFVRALKDRMPSLHNQITGFPQNLSQPLGEVVDMLSRVSPDQVSLPDLVAQRICTGLTEFTVAGGFDYSLWYLKHSEMDSTMRDVQHAIILSAEQVGADLEEFASVSRRGARLANPQWKVAIPG